MEQDIGDKLMNTGEYNFGWNIGENVIYKNYQNDQDISQPPLTKNDSTDMNFFDKNILNEKDIKKIITKINFVKYHKKIRFHLFLANFYFI
jgi:hypothetical protein